ncbi:hypothetical protein BSLA_03r1599 [Burkholderia stabilis]|nr:hypothetical protein BSLA_03r1599 [Burkholderia stabilis]
MTHIKRLSPDRTDAAPGDQPWNAKRAKTIARGGEHACDDV